MTIIQQDGPRLRKTVSGASRWKTSSACRSRGTEKIVHSSSTMLYGALDNDDMFMYMGGLATAVPQRRRRGRAGDWSSPTRAIPAAPEMTSRSTSSSAPVSARATSTRRGSREDEEELRRRRRDAAIRRATSGAGMPPSPDSVDDRCGRRRSTSTSRTSTSSGCRQFFEKSSPFAYQDITARMLETDAREGNWQANHITCEKGDAVRLQRI